MNGIDFLDGLNDIDLAYVKEAEEESLSSGIRWQHCASLAACLALMVTSGLMIALGVGGQTTPIYGRGTISPWIGRKIIFTLIWRVSSGVFPSIVIAFYTDRSEARRWSF